jgi:hypothetical protein
MARPAEVLFYCANARCKMTHPAGEKSLRRAATVYSATAASYTAPTYSANVEDALSFNQAGNNGFWCTSCSARVLFFSFSLYAFPVSRDMAVILNLLGDQATDESSARD